jgi:phosphoserine phosphatase RsbU/P
MTDPSRSGSNRTGAARPLERAADHFTSARVLVVDDVADNRDILTRRLARLGVNDILEAENGAIALDIIRATRIDLVLLDIMMPVMTGFDVLEALSREQRIEQVPVIVISAMNEMESTVRAIQLGAEDFLLKPFEPTLLRARVSAILEKQQLRARRREELERTRLELAEARSLQLALVPPQHHDSSVTIEVMLEPAREVGGDLVDHFPLADGRHVLVLGDVSGKGAGAALMMARTHSLVRSLATHADAGTLFDGLERAAEIVNRALSAGNESCTFITLVLAVHDLENGRLDYVRCGHVPPFLRRADGSVERLDLAGGLPLGIDGDTAFTAGSIRMGPGDTLVLLSDGVSEAMSADGELFGDDRVAAWLNQPHPTLSDLVERVRAFESGLPPADDLSLLVFRRTDGNTVEIG